jgi:hypothetical protein
VQTGVAHPLRNAKGGAFDFVSVLILELEVGCRTLWFLRVRLLIFIAGKISVNAKPVPQESCVYNFIYSDADESPEALDKSLKNNGRGERI